MKSFHTKEKGWQQFAISTIAVILIVVMVCFGLHKAFTSRRKASLEMQQNLLQGIVVGICSYDTLNGHMVEPIVRDEIGKRDYSWRVSILDMLEGGDYHSVAGAALDDPVNQSFLETGPTWYCFSRAGLRPPNTCVYAVVGKGTAFDQDHPRRFNELPPYLILLVEINESNTHWMQPGDLNVDRLPKSLTEGTDKTGVLVAFADGQVWFLDKSIPLQTLKKFFTIEDAKHYDREKLLEPYCKSRKGVTDKRNRWERNSKEIRGQKFGGGNSGGNSGDTNRL